MPFSNGEITFFRPKNPKGSHGQVQTCTTRKIKEILASDRSEDLYKGMKGAGNHHVRNIKGSFWVH